MFRVGNNGIADKVSEHDLQMVQTICPECSTRVRCRKDALSPGNEVVCFTCGYGVAKEDRELHANNTRW